MKNFNIILFLLLVSCADVKEGLKDKNISTGEEFLVNKKNPLIVPPDFNQLPTPTTNKTNDKSDDLSSQNIKDILDQEDNSQKTNTNKKSITSDVEENILKNIN